MMLKSLFLLATAGMASATMIPSDVRVCSTHLHCREFGDAGATCSQKHPYGQCSCSTGHSKISSTVEDVGLVVQNYNTHLCVENAEASATSLAREIPSFLTVTFTDANCADTDSVSAELKTTVEEIIGGKTVSITFTCTQNDGADLSLGLSNGGTRGVNAAIYIETLTVGDLYQKTFTRFEESLLAKLTAVPAVVEGEAATENTLKKYLGTALKNIHLYTVNAVPLMCPNENRPGQLTATVFVEAQQTVAQSTFDEQECKSLTCTSDYNLINGVCTLPTPVPPTPDDDLSDGQLAAIIIGSSVAFIACLVGIIVYCCCKKKEPEQEEVDAEEGEAKKETSPDE